MRGLFHSKELVQGHCCWLLFPHPQPRAQDHGWDHATAMGAHFSTKETNQCPFSSPHTPHPQVSVCLTEIWQAPGPGVTPGDRSTLAAPKAFGQAGQSPFSRAEHRDTAGKPGQLASGWRPGHKNAGSGHRRAEGMAVPNKVIVPKNAHIPKTQAQAWALASRAGGLGGGCEGRKEGLCLPGRGGRCLLDQKSAVPTT